MENALRDVNKQAVINASNGLSRLIDRQVEVGITRTEVKAVEDLSPLIGPEELVAGIYMPVTGDINGAALLIFPKDSTFVLSDLLVRRQPGTTHTLTNLDISALKEVGNIICGNYLTVLADALQVKITEHIPNFSFDMFGAIVSQIIADFAQKTDEALVIEIEFTIRPETFKGYFLLLFEVEQLKAILSSLVGAVGAERPS